MFLWLLMSTKARLLSTQIQLALVHYENQLFNLLLDQEGQFDLNFLPDPLYLSALKTAPGLFNSRSKKHRLGLHY